jgi:hypothetical protein
MSKPAELLQPEHCVMVFSKIRKSINAPQF